MSILLNALNKAKQDEAESDDIEQLIETPLDEQEVNEIEPETSGINFQHGLLLLLGIIAILLFAILWVLVLNNSSNTGSDLKSSEPLRQTNEPVAQQSVTTTQSKTTISSSGKSELSENIGDTSGETLTRSQSANNQPGQYLESYQPKRDNTHNRSATSAPDKQQPLTRQSSTESEASNNTVSRSNSSSLPLREMHTLTEVERMMVSEVTVDAHVYSEDASQRFIFVRGELKQEGDQLINSWLLESIEEDGIIVNNGVLRVKLEQN